MAQLRGVSVSAQDSFFGHVVTASLARKVDDIQLEMAEFRLERQAAATTTTDRMLGQVELFF